MNHQCTALVGFYCSTFFPPATPMFHRLAMCPLSELHIATRKGRPTGLLQAAAESRCVWLVTLAAQRGDFMAFHGIWVALKHSKTVGFMVMI